MKQKNNAAMYDLQTLKMAGIDPKTGLPIKIADILQSNLEKTIKQQLTVLDEQNAIHRYVWYNLPSGLTSELVERILYYKGQAIMFYMEETDSFYFLPYTLNGTIDVYGRFKSVSPLPFNGKSEIDENMEWIPGYVKQVIYDITKTDNLEAFLDGCVILTDYSIQIGQRITPRSILMDGLLDAMAEAFPMARTNLMANSGITGLRVNDQDQAAQVALANKSVQTAAKTGQPFIPIVGNLDFQNITNNGGALRSEEFMIYMQALDNYRLSLYGLKNGGLFQKKSHMLESEQQMNEGSVLFAYQDGLSLRQNFCDMCNAIWGLGIACEPNESVVINDLNGDGMLNNEQDQTGDLSGEQPKLQEEVE